MIRARTLIGVVALVTAVGCQRAPEPAPVPPPSIFLLMIDTLRADYLGSYGFQGPISPNLDRFAREAVVFDRCASVAPWTKPAIASLFTGLDPSVHQVLTHAGRYGSQPRSARLRPLETDALPEAALTLAEVLKDRGYETAAFVANPWINAKHGFAQGFDRYNDSFAGNATPAERVLEAAQGWLDRRRERSEQPVFVYLHFMDVHDPYDAPDEDVDPVRGSPSLGPSRPLTERQLPQSTVRHMRHLGLPWVASDAVHDLREWRARYAGGVRAFDRRIGPFLEMLRTSGWLDRSVVVVTSDHGEELFEHGGWTHGRNLYEHQLDVPLIVRLPGPAGEGRRVGDVVSLIDLMPTLASFAGASPPEGVNGVDLRPLLEASGGGWKREAVFASGVKSAPKLYAVRTHDHKLIQDVGQAEALLFDLAADPKEQENIVNRVPAIAFQLGDHLDRHLAMAARHPGVGRSQAFISSEVEERLRSLGYLE